MIQGIKPSTIPGFSIAFTIGFCLVCGLFLAFCNSSVMSENWHLLRMQAIAGVLYLMVVCVISGFASIYGKTAISTQVVKGAGFSTLIMVLFFAGAFTLFTLV